MPDAQAVNRFFSDIAAEYDLANRVMSSGIDILWRNYLARRVGRHQPANLLDLATGSGDVAFTLGQKVQSAETIVGMDFCDPLLDVAREKATKIKHLPLSSSNTETCLDLHCRRRSV
jgi:demethylmenaquinone methyltransferase/2-methoxy-6-polyprenyl-1,4-benzoquinol methylase